LLVGMSTCSPVRPPDCRRSRGPNAQQRRRRRYSCAGQLSLDSDCSPPSAGASVVGAPVAASVTASPAAASGASGALAAFLAGAFFFGLAASVVGAPSAAASAALNSSSLLGLAGRTCNRPSAPGSPLNFCQSPVIFSSLRTGSVGCAPTASQYWARSESISIRRGASFGWYRPTTS